MRSSVTEGSCVSVVRVRVYYMLARALWDCTFALKAVEGLKERGDETRLAKAVLGSRAASSGA